MRHLYDYIPIQLMSNFRNGSRGVDGRRDLILFRKCQATSILENDPTALPQNQFVTATSQLSIGGLSFVDLVYDATGGVDGN
jgi:hypothetical protein